MKKKIAYNPRQVRFFLVLLLLFLLLVLILLPHLIKKIPLVQMRGRGIGLAAWAVATIFFYARPRLFFPIFRLIMAGTQYLGSFIFGVITTVVFYLILTPISFFMRLAGKKFMAQKCDHSLDSYYEEGEEHGGYEKQF